MDEMNGIQFLYFLGHLSVKMFLLFTIANALVCVNVLVLTLTFWLLRKRSKQKYHKMIDFPSPLSVVEPVSKKTEFVDAGTGKREGWVKKTIWVRED